MDISVVIPIYKVEAYLKTCLESVLNQNFCQYEVICVNDCSPDGCEEIVKEYQERYRNIKYIKNDRNLGLSYSRNAGVKAAKGEYILFVDSDDYIKNDSLSNLYEIAKKDELDILYFNKQVFYDYDVQNKTEYINVIVGEEEVLTGKEMFFKFMEKKTSKSMNAYTQLLKRDFLIFNNLSFRNGIVHEDFLFFFQCANAAKKVKNLDRVFYYYRVRDDSITAKATLLHKQSIFVVLLEVLRYWNENNIGELESRAINTFCKTIYRTCSKYIRHVAGRVSNSDLMIIRDVDKFLYRSFMEFDYPNFTDLELERIKSAKRVFMYGVGEVGIKTAFFLEDNLMHIDACFVTFVNKPRKFLGWKVTSIDDVVIKDDDLIIIASDWENREAMEQELVRRNYKNYIFAAKGMIK